MNVLVTGADGFVGQHVLQALHARGHTLIGGIHGERPATGTLPRPIAARVSWRRFDLRDAGSVRTLVAESDPDAILHLAGLSSVSESWRDPESTFDVNATGALRLLQALRTLDKPRQGHARAVILVGSGEAYGADGTDAEPLREDMPLHPITPYGASKAAQEMIAHALGTHPGLRMVQTRSFQQVGPGQRPTFVTADWARQLVAIRDHDREPVLRTGDLDIARDFIDVRDAAAAYVALLESDTADGVFNVCSGRACSLRHLLDLLQDIVGVRPDIQVDPARLRPAEIRSLVGSPARLSRATGWTPRIPLADTLRAVVASLSPTVRSAAVSEGK